MRQIGEGVGLKGDAGCGISEWQGKPLSIQIDHINGLNDDYRLENLRMLCANCHSLTPTSRRRRHISPARRKLPDERPAPASSQRPWEFRNVP